MPDATTICRFHQSLVERHILKRLLDKRNHPLGRRGLLVREGAIVDASDVSSARRPLKVLAVLPENHEEDSGDALQVRGLSDGIMHKPARNQELTLAERTANGSVPKTV